MARQWGRRRARGGDWQRRGHAPGDWYGYGWEYRGGTARGRGLRRPSPAVDRRMRGGPPLVERQVRGRRGEPVRTREAGERGWVAPPEWWRSIGPEPRRYGREFRSPGHEAPRRRPAGGRPVREPRRARGRGPARA